MVGSATMRYAVMKFGWLGGLRYLLHDGILWRGPWKTVVLAWMNRVIIPLRSWWFGFRFRRRWI